MSYKELIDKLLQEGAIPLKVAETLRAFFPTYVGAVDQAKICTTFIQLVADQIKNPFIFEPYQKRTTAPFDYTTFAIEFIRPLVDLHHSKIEGIDSLNQILRKVKSGDNVILLANHQVEPDPQLIQIMLEKIAPEIALDMIFVAGQRVVTDPLAVPFSRGCNLLCIYSKKYIEHPPELKHSKQLHNQKTMKQMVTLLAEGGKCIYVAPSGGRDRKGPSGIIEVAPFDPQSIEMFRLMAQKAKTKTHFYPLALDTYAILPPPEGINHVLGEERVAKKSPVKLWFGPELVMDNLSDAEDKIKERKERAEAIWTIVKNGYERLKS